jgi:hypothetical protein
MDGACRRNSVLSRWSVTLLLSLASSAAHATEAPAERPPAEKPNTPPRFSGRLGIDPTGDFEFTQGASMLKVGRKTRVEIGAHDPDGDHLTFSVEPLPAGADLNATTGVLTWTPTRAQIGKHRLVVRVSDQRETDLQNVVLVVRENRPPLGRAGTLLSVAHEPPPEPTVDDWNVPWEPIATDPDGDEVTITVRKLPPSARFLVSKQHVSMSLRPTPSDVGEHELVADVSDGESTVTVRRRVKVLPEWAERDYRGILLPGGGTSGFLLHGDRELLVGGALQATLVARTENGRDAFLCKEGVRSSDCRASHFRIYAQFEVLGSTRAHAPSLFTYAAGYTSNFEWNPERRYLIPHYGAEAGGLFRAGVGHRAEVHPYLGLHLWADRTSWVNLTLGYRVVPAGLRDLSGPTAGLVALLNPW